MTLEEYTERIEHFYSLKAAEQIPYFGYHIINYQGKESFSAKDIDNCFALLNLTSYSNISACLSKLKQGKFLLKSKTGYLLERKFAEQISSKIGEIKVKVPSCDLFPIELLSNTRSYLQNTVRQVILSYDYGLYDACLVMIRRLIETLIIELFERYNIKDRIQDSSGNFFFCSDLIDCLLSEKTLWTIGRNTTKALPLIKTKGDLCAHNRRFNAKKADIDQIKLELRITIEELIHLINYEQWYAEQTHTR